MINKKSWHIVLVTHGLLRGCLLVHRTRLLIATVLAVNLLLANSKASAETYYPAEIHFECQTDLGTPNQGTTFSDRDSCLAAIAGALAPASRKIMEPCPVMIGSSAPFLSQGDQECTGYQRPYVPGSTVPESLRYASCEMADLGGQRKGRVAFTQVAYCAEGAADIQWSLNGSTLSAMCQAPPESTLAPAPEPAMCRRTEAMEAGNPILPGTAEKFQSETDIVDQGPFPLTFVRTYRSTWGMDAGRLSRGLGPAWGHNHAYYFDAWPATAPQLVKVILPEGYVRNFSKPSGASIWTPSNSADSLVQSTSGWTWRRSEDGAVFSFDASGKLQTQTQLNGQAISYTYSSLTGKLTGLSNSFGKSLAFNYNAAGQITSVAGSGGRTASYGYDVSGRLSSVTYPDSRSRYFLYENPSFPNALTGIVDESGARFATYVYDSQGRATSTELAGGVARYQVTYPQPSQATVVDPLGTTRNYSYTTRLGRLVAGSSSLPSGISARDASMTDLDGNGLVVYESDFKGVATTTNWDTARRLPVSVTRAHFKPEAQTVTTQWHPTFPLPVLVTESGRTVAYTYDDKGNVLSRAITDTAASPNTTRIWNWTWNAQGLAATETAPNGVTTTFEYDPAGNLVKATNALGHITQYAYDSANRLIGSTAPNGVVTSYTWDARDRLLTKTVGGQGTTTLTYKPTGLVETLTLYTGLSLIYTYDAAHRLTGWSNNRGESGSFTLDTMGNRVGEQTRDSIGAVAWMTARGINNLNRLAAKTEGPNQTNSFGYDANGELVTETNGLNQSTQYGLDPLRRVEAITNAANATAGLSYNALNAVTQARDFKGVATSYARDAQGHATSESSADIGTKSTQYDALGLPSAIVDALGQATQIQRDALGRPSLITFADGKTTTLIYDATANAKGLLSSIADRSGTTKYFRDVFGRVVGKRQTFANNLMQQTSYSYGANGLLASIGYPDGSVLAYQYDATGRLIQINRKGKPLITGIAWNPMGQPTGWNWAFTPGLSASRRYDTAGRMTASEFASYIYDSPGRITSLTQNLLQPADSDPTHSGITSADSTWSVSYDAVGRITGFNAAASQASFAYDANGNRTASTRTIDGQTTSRHYTFVAGSNRHRAFGQAAGGTSTKVGYSYNANGDLTGDGLRTYSYDAEGRLSAVTTGATDASPTTRYAHNALGQRVFKTEPLYPPAQGDEADPGFMQSLISFFTRMWGPATSDAEKQGFAFMYDEEGSLIAESGTGGANSAGSTYHIYLPTANGPMPVAAVINGQLYAVHADHLNTPRRLTDSQGQAVWQWEYSAFGDTKPTTAHNRFADLSITPNPGTTGIAETVFNLRGRGQYFDVESGLRYNYFRSLMDIGRYTQPDPLGLGGGLNRIGHVGGNPLGFTDPFGLLHGIPLDEVPILKPEPQPAVDDACVQKYLRDHYGEAMTKAINFGNLQQYVPSANPNAYGAIEEGLKIGAEKLLVAKGPGLAGNALMKANPGNLSLGYSVGSKLAGFSSVVSGAAEVGGAFLMPFGSVAMVQAREACSCKK